MMFAPSEDQQPLMYLRGYPLYATHTIVLVYVISMLVCTIAGPSGAAALEHSLGFYSSLVHRGQIWRVFTYGLVNTPSLSFVIDMVMIVWFGREVERFFGRKVFLRFYAMLYLLMPVLYTVIGFATPTALAGETGGFALFIAFATLYPNAVMLFNILAKWMAAVFLAIYTLMFIFDRSPFGLITLWVPTAFAFAFVRREQGQFDLPKITVPSFGKKPKFRVLPNPTAAAAERDEPMAEMDELLDKIAKSGINSLTSKERERLEKAREQLLKRGTPPR